MRSSNTEIHILGTLISEGTQMVDVVDVLTPDMFESVATSSVYAAMQKMFDENKGIDLVTLSERVVGNKAIEAKGGTAWLASMAANYTPGLLREYALLLKEHYVQKKALEYAREVQIAVIDGLGVDEIVSIVNRGADAVNNLLIVAGATRSVKSIIPEVLEQLEARMLVAQRRHNWHPYRLGQAIRLQTDGEEPAHCACGKTGQGKTQSSYSLCHDSCSAQIFLSLLFFRDDIYGLDGSCLDQHVKGVFRRLSGGKTDTGGLG